MTSFIKNLLLRRSKTQIILVFILLSACDGGSLQLANGIGGTGITVGRVTAFGSMYVNGIKFNTDDATFIRDGVGSRSQSDFSTGEIVKINGTVDNNKTTGVAKEVIFSDVLEGVVTKTATAKTFEVLGQKVKTDSLTVLHGFKKLTDLKLDNVVEVSGFSINGEVRASSIKLISESYVDGASLELEGYISNLDTSSQTFNINDTSIDYSMAEFVDSNIEGLSNERYVVVSAEENINNGTLSASFISLIDDELEVDTYYEIEGFVTRFDSSSDFELDGSPILTNASTTYRNGVASDISIDSHLIITGFVNSQNVLVAEDINVLNVDTEVLIEANIEAIDLQNQTITLLGKNVGINNFTLLSDETIDETNVSLTLDDFSVGDSVFVSGGDVDGRFLADRLSKVEIISSDFISGTASSIDDDLGKITLSGIQVISSSETLYFDENSDEVSMADFFSLIENNNTLLIVEGSGDGKGGFVATTLGIALD